MIAYKIFHRYTWHNNRLGPIGVGSEKLLFHETEVRKRIPKFGPYTCFKDLKSLLASNLATTQFSIFYDLCFQNRLIYKIEILKKSDEDLLYWDGEKAAGWPLHKCPEGTILIDEFKIIEPAYLGEMNWLRRSFIELLGWDKGVK